MQARYVFLLVGPDGPFTYLDVKRIFLIDVCLHFDQTCSVHQLINKQGQLACFSLIDVLRNNYYLPAHATRFKNKNFIITYCVIT